MRHPHEYRDPKPHAGGVQPPVFPADAVPRHVALVMDGNGRWAKERGLARTDGHTAGEASLFDVVEGAAQIGVEYISAYAFSTENWKRSPEEGQVPHGLQHRHDPPPDRRDGRAGCAHPLVRAAPRLWKSVIKELEIAEERTKDNTRLTLAMCINYGGRAEIVDAAAALAQDVRDGKVDPKKIDESLFAKYLDEPDMPDVDLFIRSSGEQRTSNFLLWQSAYAEMVFDNVLWPDFDRTHMWKAVESYVARDRRYGGALPNVVSTASGEAPGTALAASADDPDGAEAEAPVESKSR
ncbi:polyprenyl diphosphate synthase [Yinghuangia aomiensis]